MGPIGPLQASTIISKWLQGVFSRTSRGLHQKQHIHHDTLGINNNNNHNYLARGMATINREVTDYVPFGNQFISHKPQLSCAQILIGK